MNDQQEQTEQQSAVVLSVNNSEASHDLIRAILNCGKNNDQASSTWLTDHIEAFSLKLNTKYYTAEVRLCHCTSPTIGSEEFAESVEALIVHCDPDVDNKHLQNLDQWFSFAKHWEPEVRLLVCNRVSEALKAKILEWCIRNSFELIELQPSEESLEEAHEYGEPVGIERVLQCLKSHAWSNVTMVEEGPDFSKRMRKLLLDDDASSEVHGGVDALLMANDENALFEAANRNEDPNGVSFEALFERFRQMKEKADMLPMDQRREYAEKVTLEFWNAIGGDEGEIMGLSSSDDEVEAGP